MVTEPSSEERPAAPKFRLFPHAPGKLTLRVPSFESVVASLLEIDVRHFEAKAQCVFATPRPVAGLASHGP